MIIPENSQKSTKRCKGRYSLQWLKEAASHVEEIEEVLLKDYHVGKAQTANCSRKSVITSTTSKRVTTTFRIERRRTNVRPEIGLDPAMDATSYSSPPD